MGWRQKEGLEGGNEVTPEGDRSDACIRRKEIEVMRLCTPVGGRRDVGTRRKEIEVTPEGDGRDVGIHGEETKVMPGGDGSETAGRRSKGRPVYAERRSK